MKKGYLISIIALLVALVGVVVALAAYFKRKNGALCDEYGDDLLAQSLMTWTTIPPRWSPAVKKRKPKRKCPLRSLLLGMRSR